MSDLSNLQSKEVGTLSSDESLSSFKRRALKGAGLQTVDEELLSKNLVEILNNLALAVDIAAANLSRTACESKDIIDYKARFQREWAKSDPWEEPLVWDYVKTSVGTWKVFIHAIQDESKLAAGLLQVSGYFNNLEITDILFRYPGSLKTELCSDLLGMTAHDIPRDILVEQSNSSLSNVISDAIREDESLSRILRQALGILEAFSMIIPSGNAKFQIHPIVHSRLMNRVEEETQVQAAQMALRLLYGATKYCLDTEEFDLQRQLLSHYSIWRIYTAKFSLFHLANPKSWLVDPTIQFAKLLNSTGKWSDAILLERDVLNFQKRTQAEKGIPRTLTRLGEVIRNSGRWNEAEAVLKKVFDDQPSPPVLQESNLKAASALADIYRLKKLLPESVEMQR